MKIFPLRTLVVSISLVLSSSLFSTPMVEENSSHGPNAQRTQEYFPSVRENTSAARESSELGALSSQAERGTALLATDQTELEASVTGQEAIVSTANNTIPKETVLLPTYTPPKKYSATLLPVPEGAIEEEQVEQTISDLAKTCREKALLNESDFLFAMFYATATEACDRAARAIVTTDDLQVRYLVSNVLTRVQNAETTIDDSIMRSQEAFALLEIASASSKAAEAIAEQKDQLVIDLYNQTKTCREKALLNSVRLKEFYTIAAEACNRAAEVMTATDHLQIKYLGDKTLTLVQNAETAIDDSIMRSQEAFALLNTATASSKAAEAMDRKNNPEAKLHILAMTCHEKTAQKFSSLILTEWKKTTQSVDKALKAVDEKKSSKEVKLLALAAMCYKNSAEKREISTLNHTEISRWAHAAMAYSKAAEAINSKNTPLEAIKYYSLSGDYYEKAAMIESKIGCESINLLGRSGFCALQIAEAITARSNEQVINFYKKKLTSLLCLLHKNPA